MGGRGGGATSIGEWATHLRSDVAAAGERLVEAGAAAKSILRARARRQRWSSERTGAIDDAIADAMALALERGGRLTGAVRSPQATLASWLAGAGANFILRAEQGAARVTLAAREREWAGRADRFVDDDARFDAPSLDDDAPGAATSLSTEDPHDRACGVVPGGGADRGVGLGGEAALDAPCVSGDRDGERRSRQSERLDRAHLTEYQRRVLDLLRAGVRVGDAARRLGVSPATIRDVRARATRRASGASRAMTTGADWCGRAEHAARVRGDVTTAEILRLRREGRTIAGIAAALRVTVGTVRGRIDRQLAEARRRGWT